MDVEQECSLYEVRLKQEGQYISRVVDTFYLPRNKKDIWNSLRQERTHALRYRFLDRIWSWNGNAALNLFQHDHSVFIRAFPKKNR